MCRFAESIKEPAMPALAAAQPLPLTITTWTPEKLTFKISNFISVSNKLNATDLLCVSRRQTQPGLVYITR
ncbi:hypothetical protein E2C01_031376 [Portunus trituberculatus]|uniref:Uncharacterized protein n=1 Tax=Portunus trituberculatus TaxID=210409 RepID=A0A5B7ET97_PORTR|nr:hypothetical protein [Portunus trituberculatus]